MTDWLKTKKELEGTLANETRSSLDKTLDLDRRIQLRQVNDIIKEMTPCEYCKEKGCVDAECFW